MMRLILITLPCLLASMTVNADELPTTPHELAETMLIAEWVGLPQEQFVLGTMYYKGNGVKQDYAEAAKWYRLAADQGLAKAQHMLGVMYDSGNGMPPDYAKALSWYRVAADQAYAPAEFELGNQYAAGKGVPQNYTEAYIWFSLAAASGHEKAREQRDIYAGKLSHEEIMEAQQRAAQLFEDIQQLKTDE